VGNFFTQKPLKAGGPDARQKFLLAVALDDNQSLWLDCWFLKAKATTKSPTKHTLRIAATWSQLSSVVRYSGLPMDG